MGKRIRIHYSEYDWDDYDADKWSYVLGGSGCIILSREGEENVLYSPHHWTKVEVVDQWA